MIDRPTLNRLRSKCYGPSAEATFVQRGILRELVEMGYERLEQEQRRIMLIQKAGRMKLSVKDRMQRGTLT